MSLFGKPSVAKLKAKGDRDGLVKALRKPDPAVRLEAAEALRSLGWTPATNEQRLDFLVASGSWGEVTELGRAAPQLLVERFLGEARHHPGEEVGVGGIPLGGGQVGELLTPPDEDVRCSLVSALRDVGEPAVAPLVSALDSEDDDRISHASWALVEIGEPALEPLMALFMPRWSDGSFGTTTVGTIALAAKKSRQRGGQGFVSHIHNFKGSSNLRITRLVAGLAGEDDEYATWEDELIDRSLEEPRDANEGISCTLTVAEETVAQKIASDQDVLRTTLEQMQIVDFNSKVVLRALQQGRPISHEVFRDPAGRGFSVKLALLASETKDKADAAEVDVKPDDRETRMVGESGENLARPDWFADPTGRHEYRYWDGSSWTANVADSGNTSSDPLDVAPVVGDERLSKGTQRADDITNRLAEIDDEVGSLRDRIKRAFDTSTDAPGGNILIASVRESLGQGPPPGLEGTPTFGQVEALEKEKETLQTELAQLRHAADGGGKPHP